MPNDARLLTIVKRLPPQTRDTGGNNSNSLGDSHVRFVLYLAAVLLGGSFILGEAVAADDTAAMALAKKSKCLTCHSVDKKKDGPSFKETAAKYKGKADAEQKLYTHLTTNPTIKVDGKEEKHDNPATKNEGEIKNLIAWILSR